MNTTDDRTHGPCIAFSRTCRAIARLYRTVLTRRLDTETKPSSSHFLPPELSLKEESSLRQNPILDYCTVLAVMSWLFQEGPKAKKHTNWVHPSTTLVLHYSGVAISTILAHDWMVGQYKNSFLNESSNPDHSPPPPLYRRNVAYFLTFYFLWFFACRMGLHWKAKEAPSVFYCEFYKQTFLCSVTIFHAALALYTDRPIIATAFCIAVGPDQLLWYVDLAIYLVW
jgi:hypothetical protein